MDHSITLNVAEAHARYSVYMEKFPEKAGTSLFQWDISASITSNLDRLALFALHHSSTAAVLYGYKPVFLDLMARWTRNTADLEQSYSNLHQIQYVPGSVVLQAMSRVVDLYPESLNLIELYLSQSRIFESIDATSDSAQLQTVLLALFRLYHAKPHRFKPYISVSTLYRVMQLGPEYNVAKYLAVCMLGPYLNASETSIDTMVQNHVSGSLEGLYDDCRIDYQFLALVEAKRISNYMKLSPYVTSETQNVVVTTDDLSPLVISVCGILVSKCESQNQSATPEVDLAVRTENSVHVLQQLATHIQNDRPVMLYGSAGSGKTFLIHQLARYLGVDNIVKIHLGDQTDAKLLLGTYTSGEKPGSFQWRSGVLTTAVREGKWVLVEDIDKAPTEVLSILLTLLEKRELTIPSRGEVVRAHRGFQLILTIRTDERVPDMIGLRLWNHVLVQTPSEMELRTILASKFPRLRTLIARFILMYNKILEIYALGSFISLNRGSHPRVISTRDLMKFCSRCNQMLVNQGVTSELMESHIYENIFAEAVDCFGSALTEYSALVPVVNAIGEILEVPSSRVNLFLLSYVPTLHVSDTTIEIGRAVLKADPMPFGRKSANETTFARTKHSRRLMEQIGVAIEMVEPVLLVGETGTGKTTVVQEVAKMMHKKLTVINVSQQTESGDLLGGYKPVNTKTVAIPLQEMFETLFLATFSLKKNARFSQLLTKCFNKNQWKNVIKLWNEAVRMASELLKVESDDENGAPKKKRKLRLTEKSVLLDKWHDFKDNVALFESQAANLDQSFVFSFVEGSLVKAVKNGEWLLLDEINLASPDTLESIADLLSESQRSILLSERGDTDAIIAHPDFRLFGCMNPSTDVGKKDLPVSIRSRFSEIYVHSPDRDREDLLSIIDKYIARYAVGDDWVGDDIAELYCEAKRLAESNQIVDGANQKPHFSIRTLTRTLLYVRDIVGVYGLRRALYEGFCMAFLTLLDIKSEKVLEPVIAKYTTAKVKNKTFLTRCPPPPEGDYVQFRHYWMKRGPGEIRSPNYIITPFVEKNLLNLVRATASRKFPVLVQGPTSAGKTSMINYLASITGHKFVRINNHEHTDLQEYLGTYVSDSTGKLVFREGVLVEALRKGHWIVLDELNLAPTDVLEALNRLLDDNRELFIPETQEVVHPHPDFMLFATQNPPGLYGGRKVLSRAFRNRFLELHFDDIPQDELEIILKERCQIAPSYGKKIVEVYKQLLLRRQSTRLFEQKNSFATLRDLFRWAMREAVGYDQLAANGYMLLAERVRNDEEKSVVKETIEKVMRVKLDMDVYYELLENKNLISELSIVWTKAMRRLAVLVETSIKYKEPLLLVGETGCGKTTVCQILAKLLGRQIITVNAHQNTETGDILGAQRPLRNRFEVRLNLLKSLFRFFALANIDVSQDSSVDDLVKKYQQTKATVDMPELIAEIDASIKNSTMLFEWMDGPLVQAMKTGDFFLLDEISLADDSVLERLNSVLEPERSLLLAEKGTDDAFLTAADTFQFLATMNPGGDYGKKELSPALRNRFTEIWVPSMDDFADVKQIVSARLDDRYNGVCDALVNFSEWFGKKLGNGNTNSGVISLRDILAWVEFLNSCNRSILPEAALIHGASMVFIDALGTNNTAYLAENEDNLALQKRECVDKLSDLANMDLSQYLTSATVTITESTLKAGDFEISRVPGPWNDPFNLHAPTTAGNAMRVVRAMQVPKPILLEGSPGVGKTSLVSAIAKATGHPLIRINLSEQTDLIDLFGSDAPVEGGQTGEFVWKDAPFLRAMKNGEWVLLDEMNLASQSVLEGLNACLDHRGEAYIPELDRSFPRHPNFKVFAAQNPQYQGGGRKGLPKSFVNRFTVVYVDMLKADDLIMISHRIFPNIAMDDCEKMVSFMSALEDAVSKKLWGTSGGPWEFNLRDTMRWLALYNSKYNLSATDTSLGDFLKMIVCQRFRTEEDRQHALELFESVFGPSLQKDPFYTLGPDYVQAGGAVIARKEVLQFSNSTDRIQYVPLQANFEVLESAIRSVNENIPFILTGPTNSGKTEAIRFLADVVGVKLVEFAMNSDVDSMDILGGYEQVDLTRSLTDIASAVHEVVTRLVVINLNESKAEKHVLTAAIGFIQFLENVSIGSANYADFLSRFKSFLSLYSNEELKGLLSNAQALEARLEESSTVKFKWFDGLLVKAVAQGDWLVLDNANLCNPSVLDRLNSLLETNGSLIINECSSEDGSPRVLEPHPNFRLFLTVDPKYGELSRAMRNRCVELYLPDLEERATHFDRACLGYNRVSGGSDITEMMNELDVEEHDSRPLVSFISATDSRLRDIVEVHDAIDFGHELIPSALVGMLTLSHLSTFWEWTATAIALKEFSSAEMDILEETATLLKGLNDAGFLDNASAMYHTTRKSPISTQSFDTNQAFHPLINRYILGFISEYAPAVDSGEPTMLLQVASRAIRAKIVLNNVENKALHGKAGDLSFLEMSAAKHLGRELKKAPRVDIYSYVKGIHEFVNRVFLASMEKSEFFVLPSNLYTSLVDLQTLWFCLVDVCSRQNISKLRVFHSMLTHWFEENGTLPIISHFAAHVKSLDLGLKLTSGFSMVKIWECFRQVYPNSEAAWENYMGLLALLNDLDTLSRKLYPDMYVEVSSLRVQILSLHDEILNNKLAPEELSELFGALSTSMKRLSELSESFVVKRTNEFEYEFTALSNFLEVQACYGEQNYDKRVSLTNYTAKPTTSLLANKRFLPYPRILDSLWNKEGSSLVDCMFSNNLLSSALGKTVKLELSPGKFLDQNLADMKTLSGELVESSEAILADQQQNFRKLVRNWMSEVLRAHGISVDVELLGIKSLTLAINECAEPAVLATFNDFFLPALYLAESNNLLDLGKAWVFFSSGCIQLFVPSSPLDPAIEEHVAYDVLEAQKQLAKNMVDSWKTVRSVISGDDELQLERYLPDMSKAKLEKPRVFRKDESIDDLFEEWSAFMSSSIDSESIKQLLHAAENLAEDRSFLTVCIFHKNSSNFMMRLGSKYFIYADLNEILNGFIRGLKLGLELLTINHASETAKYQLSSMWPVDMGNLLNSKNLEATFLTVKNMSKANNAGSLDSEKLMLYIVRLCFVQKCGAKDSTLDLVMNQALQSLYYRWYYRRLKAEEEAAQAGSLYKHKDTDDAEEDFRELFPDYDEVMDIGAVSKQKDDFEDMYYEMAKLYVDHFLHGAALSLKDTCQRGAKLLLSNEYALNPNNPSYLSALILSIRDSYELYSLNSEKDVDFYHDAHPAEYRRAMKVILSIYNSVAKLLSQWPEHATLQSISRSAEEFLAYPSNYPLAKLLHKIELIFNFMNEWEKFASSQVTLKNHYDELTTLIVSWRKLELSSWKCLFKFEKANLEKGIGKWWFHLFESIIVPFMNDNDDEPSVIQLLSVLNIYMSESTYAEYVPRLNLVKAFKNHIDTLKVEGIYDTLCNFITFYEQFIPKIENAVEQTEKSLSKDVLEVILLASWKDVNIDALKQSSRRSHNNLYKIVRKYRALLNTPVSPIIQAGVEDRIILEEKTIRAFEVVSRTKDEKVVILKSCNGVSTWGERSNILKNVDTIENNMKVYVDKIARAEAPSIHDYAKEVIDEMNRLRDETPKVLNEDTKKIVAALKTQKHKLLSDTLKELRRIGVKTTSTPLVKKVLATVNVILANTRTFQDSLLQGCDSYYFAILDILPRLRSAVSGGNDDIPQPDLERGLAATENLIFSLLTTRKPLAELAISAQAMMELTPIFDKVGNNENGDIQPATVVSSIALNMEQLRQMAIYLCKLLDYALAVVVSISSLHKTVDGEVFLSARTTFESFTAERKPVVFSQTEVSHIFAFKSSLTNLLSALEAWKSKYPGCSFVADMIIGWIQKWPYRPFINSSTSLKELKTVEHVEMSLRKLSSSILIAVQKIVELHQNEIDDDSDEWLSSSQHRLISSIKLLHHKRIVAIMKSCKSLIEQIEQNSETSLIVSSLVSFTMPLIGQYQKLVLNMLEKGRTNYIQVSNATHAMAKSLHTLATQGFCSPEPPSEQKQDDNLHDGTGLGEGEGATNNSKDEEEDDDLAEHAQQPNEEKDKDDNEDDDDAVDIEGEMAGDLEETSDQEQEDEEKEEEEEDLDEEVDDIDDLDPNAIDEKMWDEEAKDDKEKDSDKMPQNSTEDDNMEANEDETNEDKNDDKNDNKNDPNDEDDENDNDNDASDEEDVGEQEDEVKNQENEQMDEFVPETETLDLPDDMNLDDDEEDKEDDLDDMEMDDDKEDKQDDSEEQGQEEVKEEEAMNEEEVNEEEGEDHEDPEAHEEEDQEDEIDVDEEMEEAEVPGGDIDEDNMSEEETIGPEEPKEDDKEEESAENGEEAAEGVDGGQDEENDNMDMDAATKNESGEKGEGSDNQVEEENNDIGASGSTNMKQEENREETENSAHDEMKESLKQLGDSLKEFHRRRQEIKQSSDTQENDESANVRPDEFEHVDGDNTSHDTQALGAADNKDQIQAIDDEMAIEEEQEIEKDEETDIQVKDDENDDMDVDEQPGEINDDSNAKSKGAVVGERRNTAEDNVLAKAEFEDAEISELQDTYTINTSDVPAMDIAQARDLWRHSEIATQELASGLLEQLRLILEPTLATKLRGDYKTGKRLNMKRIIPYIASDFRKDKIWLRRTKPSKRQYQIMIAVDDSKSMSESKSTELAFHSIALVSKALTQLESGGLSIVRFGEDVKLVHPFDKPFTQETGAGVFQWFDFQQERTDIKQLCVKSLKIFENARATSNTDLWQLQIILSDGVCEDHATLQQLVRRAREDKVMLVFVVIDGISSNESIMDMSQVSYVPDPVTGAMSLRVENYLDTFPFEFYVVVHNIAELPEMLSLILRQYFSEVANM